MSRLPSIFLLCLLAGLALVITGCGSAVPGMGTDSNLNSGPVQQITLVGKTYTLVGVKTSAFGPTTYVPPSSMTINLTSSTEISGSFNCYTGDSSNGATAQFSATANWLQGAVSISNVQVNQSNCQPFDNFNLQQTFTYTLSGNQLTLTNFARNQTAVFQQQ